MDRLAGLSAFVQTAQTRSFVAAGRQIGISASAVGKSVARLEEKLGVRLFQRSTRRISLTEEGALFYERCRRILDDVAEAEAMLSAATERPRGRLRISLPTIGYRFLLPVLCEFRQLYPDIELDLDFNDQIVDVIEDGFDAAIRSGDLPDSGLMTRRLGPFRNLICAAPNYLERYGRPEQPLELERHSCLRFRFPTTGKIQDWLLKGGAEFRPPNGLTLNNMEAIRAAAISGLGIAYMPDFLLADALADGRLVRLLDDHLDYEGQFSLLWPSNRHLSPKIRVLVDFLTARLFR